MTLGSKRAGDLVRAARLVEGVIDTLDDSGSNCHECGLHSFHKFGEATLKRELASVASKLRKAANGGK